MSQPVFVKRLIYNGSFKNFFLQAKKATSGKLRAAVHSSSVSNQTDLMMLSDLSVSSTVDCHEDISSSLRDELHPSPNTTSPAPVPILRCVDKASTSLPSRLTLTEDYIRASVGFRRIDTIKGHLQDLYQTTVHLDSLPADAVLDKGDLSTLQKRDRSTKPVVRPECFGDVIHTDIVFGPDIAIGNVHYGLLFTDRFSRMTYLYPLKNLTTDISKQIEAFFAFLGFIPKRLITDFNTKLIGGQAREYLNRLLIHVNAAPFYWQDKNGLAECHLQTIIAMARNWLASAELPGTFWLFAVKRAAEVCNYFPLKLECSTWTTPLQLAHNVKPDLRNLFCLFSVAAVHRGKYQPEVFIYRLDESTSIFTPKFMLESSVLMHTHSPPSMATVIGIPTYDKLDVYTVSFCDGSISEYTKSIERSTSR